MGNGPAPNARARYWHPVMQYLGVNKVNSYSQGCYLGVLGGMGPMAGAAFALRLAALTPADADQQHIPTLLRNDPRIPDRSSAYMAGGENPLPYMVEGVRFLERAGAQLIAIPCNTAHLWYDDIAAATQRPVLHIIQAVIDDLRRLGLQQGRIGLMGTAATLKLGLYQRHLEAQGYECIVPDDDEVERSAWPRSAPSRATSSKPPSPPPPTASPASRPAAPTLSSSAAPNCRWPCPTPCVPASASP